MSLSAVLFATIVLVAVVVCGAPHQPHNPIIGILVEPSSDGGKCESYFAERNIHEPPLTNASGCVWSIYVKWLESSGIRVVPVPWNAGIEKIDWYMARVNGIFLPGGILGDSSAMADYFPIVQHIFKKVVEYNARGDRMVLWGTCQGFEVVNAAAAGSIDAVVSGFEGMDPLMMAVNFTEAAEHSDMYKNAPEFIIDNMHKFNTTLNWHHQGISPSEYTSGKFSTNLSKSLKILTTTNDMNGRTFVSSVEGVDAAIYAVQFHPERPPTQFTNNAITHDLHSIAVSNYLTMFLRKKLMENNHHFESPLDAEKLMIENYPAVNIGYGVQIYYF